MLIHVSKGSQWWLTKIKFSIASATKTAPYGLNFGEHHKRITTLGDKRVTESLNTAYNDILLFNGVTVTLYIRIPTGAGILSCKSVFREMRL